MNNSRKSIKKNYFFNLAYQVLSLITPLLTTPYISRVLGPEKIGVSSYTASIVAYFTMFAALGLNIYGQREIAYSQGDKHKQSIRFWEIEIFRLITVGSSTCIYLFFVFWYGSYINIFLIQTLLIINVFLDITWFFQGNEDFKSVVVKNILVKLIGIILIFAFVKTSDDLILYVAIHVATTFLGNLFLWFGIKDKIEVVKLSELKPFENIRTYFELFITIIAGQVYNVLDKTMLGAITGNTVENGYYEQTTRIINLCIAIITSLGPVLLPRVATAFANKQKSVIKDTVNRAYHFVFMMSCPICIGVIATSSFLVPWFFGPEYEKVRLLLKIYALVLLIIPLSNTAGYAVLNPTKQHNKGTVAICCGAVTNLLLNSILIPRLASVGASIATVVAESMVTLVYFYYIREYVNFGHLLKLWVKYFSSAILMGIVVLIAGKALESVGVNYFVITFLQVIIGIIFYGALLLFIIKDEYVINTLNKILAKVFHK